MKSFLKYVMVVASICALASLTIMANETEKMKKRVTFPSDITVKGTPVKAGTYKVEFDSQSGELSILKGSKVLAKTNARWEKREGKAKQNSITTATGGNELKSIAFDGEDENLVVTD